MKKIKENKKYLIKQNNYIGLLFFALVLASLLYIIKNKTELYKEIEPPINAIESIKEEPSIITEETDQIKDLEKYLNTGDENTFKIYQSMYINNTEVSIDNLNEETMLYIAYKYIEKTTDFTNNLKYITCEEANKINLSQNIIQCGGSKNNISYYIVNHYINKDILKETIRKIFNRTIQNFTNFYTSENNLCYYVSNEYLCVTHQTTNTTTNYAKEFVEARIYKDKLEIIEKYKYINKNIYYKGFISNEVGEGTYISTFDKINGNYYWSNTKPYNEN